MSYSATYLDTQTQTYHTLPLDYKRLRFLAAAFSLFSKRVPLRIQDIPPVYDLDHHNYNFRPVSSSPPVTFEQVVRV
jgi:hypothetical protein